MGGVPYGFLAVYAYYESSDSLDHDRLWLFIPKPSPKGNQWGLRIMHSPVHEK